MTQTKIRLSASVVTAQPSMVVTTPSTTRAIVLTSQRTGSIFLQQCLDSHPDIRCYGEILIGYDGLYKKRPPQFLKKYRRLRTAWQWLASGAAMRPVATMKDCYDKVSEPVGMFRVMYNQLDRDPRSLPYLTSDPSIKVIHLVRDNVLRQYVSLYLMHRQAKLGRYNAHTTKKLPPAKLPINPQAAIKGMRTLLAKRDEYRRKFATHPMYEVSYEAMTAGGQMPREIADGLTDFLGVGNQDLMAGIVKMNPNDLSQMITNYDEFAACLRESEFAKYLNS